MPSRTARRARLARAVFLGAFAAVPTVFCQAAPPPAIFEPSAGEPASPPATLESLIHWDAQRGAFAIADRGDSQHRSRRSPNGQQALLLLTYGSEVTQGRPPHRLRRDLPWLNYERRPGTTVGIALLHLDLRTHTVRAVHLPFGLERAPADVAWWGDDRIALVGPVRDGVLRNNDPTLRGPAAITRVRLRDETYDEIAIPDRVGQTLLAGVADFTSSLVASGSRVAVSLWLPQVAGGGSGTVLFDVGRAALHFTREVDGYSLSNAWFADGRLRGPDWTYSTAGDRKSTLSPAELEPRLGRVTGTCQAMLSGIDCTRPEGFYFPDAPQDPAVAVKPARLPPDLRPHVVTVTWKMSSRFDPSAQCRIDSVSNSEPGSDDDWKILDAHRARLLARPPAPPSPILEPGMRGDDGAQERVYSILVGCTDRAGAAVGTAYVTVPRPPRRR